MKRISPPYVRPRWLRPVIIGLTLVPFLLFIYVAHSQDPAPTRSTLQGRSQTVVLVPNSTVNAGEVAFRADRDNDGMPDAEEVANGTDPDDPADADADADQDGLTNGDEVAGGSNPNATDSDGDGANDLQEVLLGFSPTDPNNTPPSNATLVSIIVTPNPINLDINTVFGQDLVQLRVTGVRNDSSTFDLTGSPTLSYESLDQGIAVVDGSGNVAGVAAGTTTIRVTTGNVFAEVPAVVTSFTPNTVAEIAIPGYANNVDVSGNHAYIAAGSAGLVIVDVTNTDDPQILTAFDTPGNANDVRVVGGRAYVADGSSGLQIIDVSTPASPVLLGSLDTPGDANDLVVRDTRVYLADGPAGVRIIDVSNPAAPGTLGSVNTSGSARGVDVSEDWVVVADETSVQIINATTPTAPVVTSSVTDMFGMVLDVEVRNRLAYVAVFNQGGLNLVDFSTPAAPRLIANVFGFSLKDIALTDRLVVGADGLFPNFLPIMDIGDPANPFFNAVLNVQSSQVLRGTGLAVTDRHIFETAANDINNSNNGVTGTSRLSILAYQGAPGNVSDTGGIAPTVTISAPQNGSSTIEGDPLPVAITATDDVRVATVQLIVNDVVIAEDRVAPYGITYFVPHDVTSLVIRARAVDTAGNAATSAPVTVNVLPDPPPTVIITFPEEGQQLYERQDVFLVAEATDNNNVAQVFFRIDNTIFENFSSFNVPVGTTSLTIEAVAVDNFGNSAATTRTFSVIPDPPPSVAILAPAEGTELMEGQVAEFIAEVSDNLFLGTVEFTINGEVFFDFDPPFRQSFTIPTGITSLLVEVRATDNLEQQTVASRTYTVIPDPGTTVTGRVIDTFGLPIEGATAKVGQLTAPTDANGVFTIPDVPTAQEQVLVRVTATLAGLPAANSSLPTPAVRGGQTDVGDITLSVGPTAPSAFGFADYNGDFVPDVFVGYPDRQSLIYTFADGQFTADANLLLPYGAVTSGANLDISFGSEHLILAQLAGRPGSITEVSFTNGVMQPPASIDTGLSSESEFTAAGLDRPQNSSDLRSTLRSKLHTSNLSESSFNSNNVVLAFLTNGSGTTKLTVRFGEGEEEPPVETLRGIGPNSTSQSPGAAAASFGDPEVLPVDPSVRLRSLLLADVNEDGLVDVLVIKPQAGTDAKLVVYLRTGDTSFGEPIESSVVVRAAVPSRGAVDFVTGNLAGDSNLDIAVIGDDGVRIYAGDGNGAFTSAGQIAIPAGTIATGLTASDVSGDGLADLLVTTQSSTTPTNKELRVYLNTFDNGFESPTITSYTGPVSSGDTRIGIGDFGGEFRKLDAVVLDGDSIRILLDIGPTRSSS
jgi:hypothetical protein